MVFSDTQQAVLTTILYSDVFDFPLTEAELWHYLISKKRITKKAFQDALTSLITSNVLRKRDTFICLAKKEQMITKRKKYLGEVSQKLELAIKTADTLRAIPSIKFIGISGGLAVGNASEKDDIDFFIITQKGTLFTTRLLILLQLEQMGLRRSWNTKHAANTICVNLLIDETQLSWSPQKRDLYTAHEIAQLKPLFQRDDIYNKFIQENVWIEQYLSNWTPESISQVKNSKGSTWMNSLFSIPFSETFLQFLQIFYMKRHQTTEHIENQFLAFHPNDYKTKTLAQLSSKCKQLGLLTKF